MITRELDANHEHTIRIHFKINCYLFVLISILNIFSSLHLKLLKPMVCETGQRFTLRLGDMTLGTGVITKINKNLTEEERLKLMEGKKARERASAKK